MHYVMCILQILPRGYPSLDMGIDMGLYIMEKLSSGLTHLCVPGCYRILHWWSIKKEKSDVEQAEDNPDSRCPVREIYLLQ